jgi:cell division transport system ATP-binding protein
VLIDGSDVAALTETARAKLRRAALGFVFQFFNLIPTLTAAENVELPLALNGVSRHDARRRSIALLDELGVAVCADRLPDEISGGEQQRVAIARAFVNRPLVLLADEPTGNLDPETSKDIMDLLERINRTGTTVLMATHDHHIVDSMRQRVVELSLGRLVRDEQRGIYGMDR